MKKVTKAISLVLSVIVMLACFVPAFANDNVIYTYNGVKYSLNITYYSASVCGCEDDISGAVTVPTAISYNGREYKVNRIEQNAFADKTQINSIRIEEGVAQIDGNAFKNCTGLREMYLPQTLAVCAVTAFNGCTNLTVYAYKRLSNLPVIEASTNVNFVYLDEPADADGFFEGLWQMIVDFFNRIFDFFKNAAGV